MKKLHLFIILLALSACGGEPAFIKKDYASFGTSKYPPIVLWVNSGQACFGKTKCTYGDVFLEELRNTGAFHNIDVYNQQADYRLKIQFYARGSDGQSLHEKTAGILPSHVKQKYNATFEIEGEYGMVKTYYYTMTGTDIEYLGANDNREKMRREAISTAVANFVADLQRDNVLPLTENY